MVAEWINAIMAAWEGKVEAMRQFWTKKCRDTIAEHDRSLKGDDMIYTHTRTYILIHHGVEGKESPLFKIDKQHGNSHSYTSNLARAEMFQTYLDAASAAKEENEVLKELGHPLAGHIEVGELFVRDYEPKEEEIL